jgi:YesN/AraC family two-component response regulator
MRQNKISLKKSSMIVRLFRTIALFLIIPLAVVGLIFNYYMMKYSQREIGRSVIINLKTIKNMNDILVDSVSRDIIRFSLNTALGDLKDIKDYYTLKDNVDNLIKLKRASNIIKSTFNSNYRLHSIYVYLEEANYLITSAEEGIVVKNEFNDMGWLEAYNEKKEASNGTIWLNSRRIGQDKGNADRNISAVNVITFILPLKNLSLNLDGAIVVNVNEKELSNLINNTDLTSSGHVFIMDNTGEIVSHIDKSLVTNNIKNEPYVDKVISSPDSTGYIIETFDNKKQLVAYNKTGFNNWIYVGVFSLSNLLENVNALRNNIIIILAFIIILGIVMSFFMSRRLYHPLNTLVQAVKQRKGIDLKDDENEVALLSRAFTTIARKEDALLDILEKNKLNMKEKYLMNLLKGDSDKPSLEFQTEFAYKYFICSVLTIDRYERFTKVYSKEQQHYMKMLIMKVCEDVISGPYKVASTLYDVNKMVIVINADFNDKDQVAMDISSNYRKVQEEISKAFDSTITVAIGGCHEGEYGVYSSFVEALETLKHKLICGYGKIISYNSATIKENKYFYPSNAEKHIMNKLSLGLVDEALPAVRELILDLRSRPYISSDNMLQIFMQLLGNTARFLMDNNINISDIFGHDYNIYQIVVGKETLEEIENWLLKFYSEIIEYMNKDKNEGKDHAKKVFEFIKNNLKNNIDVTAIADYSGISYSYVRKLVKDKSGKTVVDYINGLRIEESKRLLKESEMGMSDIALQVGYNNYQSFNRFFQKYEGITPGEFRNAEA